MLGHDLQNQLAAPTRQLRIIVGSLTAGCAIFMAVHFPNRSRVAA